MQRPFSSLLTPKIWIMIDRFKQAINAVDPASNIRDMAKPGVLAFSLIFILLPWLPAGPEGSVSGAGAVGYLLTSDESGAWLQDNPLGTIFIMIAIPATIFLCFVVFYRAITYQPTYVLQILLVVLPLLAIKFASIPVLEQSSPEILFIPVPKVGLSLMILIHLAVMCWGAVQYLREKLVQSLQP